MELYNLLETYAREMKVPPDPDSATPSLGQSLSLLHSCLIEAGMENEQVLGFRMITDPPQALSPVHFSRFIIGYLPNNTDASKSESNNILFDIYSFFKWLNQKNISHGLKNIEFQKAVQDISAHRERCVQLGDLIDSLTEDTLEEPPVIYETWHDVFTVIRILSDSINIQGQKRKEPIRVFLPTDLLKWVRNDDRMELTIGSTTERWIIIEENAIFPGYTLSNNSW